MGPDQGVFVIKAILVATVLNLAVSIAAVWWAYSAWEAADMASVNASLAKATCDFIAE